jgi:hypothetical protein
LTIIVPAPRKSQQRGKHTFSQLDCSKGLSLARELLRFL